ncbi:MAG TPA: hypothetical protein VMJ93_08935 [Verrucomicrobiae bacterium]|nr:hypothetical protein [Verrucomicrobiae bacterium]
MNVTTRGYTRASPEPNLGLRRPAILFLSIFYIAVTALTREVAMADTYYYISSILKYSGGRDLIFWDFGHLMWRPAIWALFRFANLIAPAADSSSLVLHTMLAANWLAGLGCVLLFARVTRRFASPHITILATLAMMLNQAFLNYVHTGAAYVFGLFFLLLAMDLSTVQTDRDWDSWGGCSLLGASLAVAVLVWLPYLFAVPAILLLSIVLHGLNRRSIWFSLRATSVCALVGLGAYSCVALKLHLSSIDEIHNWIAISSHSLIPIGGFPRAIYGFNRSWFEMGRAGIEFRRFLLKDPYVHISFGTLFFAGFWKLILTYTLFGAIVLKLALGSTADRRILAFLALAFVPVFAFGLKWYGGDMERYLDAIPAVLFAAACALDSRPPLVLKVTSIGFIFALLAVNVPKDLRWVRDAEDRSLAARLSVLGPKAANGYIVVFPGDPLLGLEPISLRPSDSFAVAPEISPIVPLGYRNEREWRAIFASTALKTWQREDEVWICGGLLDPTPQRGWGWVEGAGPSAHWADIHSFFSHLQVSERRGDFVQLPPTPGNVEFLGAIPPPPDR